MGMIHTHKFITINFFLRIVNSYFFSIFNFYFDLLSSVSKDWSHAKKDLENLDLQAAERYHVNQLYSCSSCMLQYEDQCFHTKLYHFILS